MGNDPLVWGYGARMCSINWQLWGFWPRSHKNCSLRNSALTTLSSVVLVALIQISQLLFSYQLRPSSARQAAAWVNPSGPALGGPQGSGVDTK